MGDCNCLAVLEFRPNVVDKTDGVFGGPVARDTGNKNIYLWYRFLSRHVISGDMPYGALHLCTIAVIPHCRTCFLVPPRSPEHYPASKFAPGATSWISALLTILAPPCAH